MLQPDVFYEHTMLRPGPHSIYSAPLAGFKGAAKGREGRGGRRGE